MKITLRYWKRKDGMFAPDYSQDYEKVFKGDNAAECMQKVKEYKRNHDLAKYTIAEIINVED